MENSISYVEMMHDRNRANAFANKIGIYLTEISDGYATAELKVDESLANPLGTMHGGCIYSLADIVSGAAACSSGRRYVTLEGKINYLVSVKDVSWVMATGRVLKAGKKICVVNVDVSDSSRTKLYATATFTMYSID